MIRKYLLILTLVLMLLITTGCGNYILDTQLRDYDSILNVKIKSIEKGSYFDEIVCQGSNGDVKNLYLINDGTKFYESIQMELKRNQDAKFDIIYKFKNDVIVVMSLHE